MNARVQKRQFLLREAAACLNERGVSQTSLSTIATRVGLTRAALYYYMEDQQDLVFQCYLQTCEVMAERLEAAVSRGKTACDVVVAFVNGMVDERAPEVAALNELAYLRDGQRRTVLKQHGKVMAGLREVLDMGIAEGHVRPLDSVVVSQAVLGMAFWVPLTRRWPTTVSVRRPDLVRGIRTLLLDGIASERRADFDYEPMQLDVPSIPLSDLFDNERLAAAKQEALLAAASWIFNLKGVEATSLEEVAARVGVTTKVIYHNVGDKEALVTNCYRRAFNFYESLGTRAERYRGSRLQAVCAAAHALAEATLREELAPLTPVAGIESLPPTIQREVAEAVARLLKTHTRIYECGQRQGSLRQFDVHAVLAVRHATHEWLPKWYADAAPYQVAHIAREIADFTRLGIRRVRRN